MKYYAIKFNIQTSDELMQIAKDLLTDCSAEAGCESFEETDNGIIAYAQQEVWDKEEMDSQIESFPLDDTKITYTIEEAEDKDWNQCWEDEGFDPITVDNKIVIYDAKHTTLDELCSFTDKAPIAIAIDAKLAFGTGTHQTTRMIVSTLLHSDIEGKRVLDCGCGTGILGITASKLGAQEVVGYDIDEWSVENTRHNAEINKVENMDVLHGDSTVLNHISGVFDIVLANINRNILLQDMHQFRDVMAGNSKLILSGFYEEDVPLLLEKAKELGLEEYGRKTDTNWCCLALTTTHYHTCR
ncbi:MAG: 50S ribosomal protein L11 methyltransferase [Prevotella sp.]|jgi:ribosomal protein L11 methyltransferase|nr:50S ribosomal protein L11 methyltransferase [Prevotella sp.]